MAFGFTINIWGFVHWTFFFFIPFRTRFTKNKAAEILLWQQAFLMRWYSLGVEFSDNGKSNDTQRHNGDVVASAHQSREQHGVGCWPEHVTMNLLPAIPVSYTHLTLPTNAEV